MHTIEQNPAKKQINTHTFVYWKTSDKPYYWITSVDCTDENAVVEMTVKAMENLRLTIRDLVVWAVGTEDVPVRILPVKNCSIVGIHELATVRKDVLEKVLTAAAQSPEYLNYQEIAKACRLLIDGKPLLSHEWVYKDQVFKATLLYQSEVSRKFRIEFLHGTTFFLTGNIELDNDGFIASSTRRLGDWPAIMGRAQQEINDWWNKSVTKQESDPTSN